MYKFVVFIDNQIVTKQAKSGVFSAKMEFL